MKEKKQSSITNIFVYLLMFIFIILIIIPPLTRVFFKEENTNINSSSNNGINSAIALTCRKEVTVGTMIYNVTVTSNYGNNILNKVTFDYEQPEIIDQTIVDNPVLTEMNTIRNSGLVDETTNGLSTTFILTKETKEANPTNTSLDNYFQPFDTQKTNLESLGYTCSTLTA